MQMDVHTPSARTYPGQESLLRIGNWSRDNAIVVLRRAAEVFLVLVLLLFGYLIFSSNRPAPSSAISTPPPIAPYRPSPDYGHLADLHIFGAPPAADSNQPANNVDASLVLDGIVASDNEKESLALISIGGDAKSYLIGQTLQDGETLVHIEPTAIVLEHAGETRRLELDIKYADSNAVFHMANLTGNSSAVWSDAYLDSSSDKSSGSVIPHNPAGIAIVPAAIDTRGSAMSLRAIREARADRFAQFKGAPIKQLTAHTPKPQ